MQNNNPSTRTQTMFFFCSLEGGILEETSGRRHLGGIWEAFGGSLGTLWGALWELGRPWGLQGHLGQKMLQIHCVLQQTQPKKKVSFRLGFLGVGVTIVCVLQQLSAGAEPQRPSKHLGQKMLQIHYVFQQKSKTTQFHLSFLGVGVTIARVL